MALSPVHRTNPTATEQIVRLLRTLRPPLPGLGFHAATWDDGDDMVPPREEQRIAMRMPSRRRADFLLGRHALRGAARSIGVDGLADPIGTGERGAPDVPSDLAASLSHSGGVAVALVAESARFATVGVDLELTGLPVEAAHLVLNEQERGWLTECQTRDQQEHRLLAAFSAKEAAFKALDRLADLGTPRRVQLLPTDGGFIAWSPRRYAERLRVRVHPIGHGVLTWTAAGA
jgi:4'-phosphopantetheinyl transferase EntD